MKRSSMELLAPAGGPEQFKAALAGGCDAIYCGFGHRFNARRGATSFDDESFAEACRLAHLAGARVYVTVNVAVKTHEMERALSLVRRVWLLGADAIIIQDWGLVDEVRRLWPEVEVHVSTQANVHDARGVAWCRDGFGVGRVTLSRELSVAEIARIAQEGVELEGFAHGALCFSYSGICMMSVCAGDRSANRGMCAQPCRLPYELVDGEGGLLGPTGMRPLCPKDCCTISRLDELDVAGLGSLKVEGRLKSSDYVFAVIRSYRSALDELAGKKPALTPEERGQLLRRSFNRDFTDAYLDGRSDNDMMSYERSNNRGELVGAVVETRDLGSARVWRGGANGGRERTRKVSVAEVDIRLDAPVGKGDLLEIRPVGDPSQFLTAHAPADAQAGETITCRTKRPMPRASQVRVIRSQRALDDAARAVRADVPRQREVNVRIVAHVGEPFVVELTCVDDGVTASASGFVVEAARTRSVSEQDLIDHVGRMGSSFFCPASFEVELDEGCGMRFSDVHKVRSDACHALASALLASYDARDLRRAPTEATLLAEAVARLGAPRDGEAGSSAEVAARTGEVEVCALVTSPHAARAARTAGATRIYAGWEALAQDGWDADETPIAWLDEVCREADHAHLDPLVVAGGPVAVGSVSELALAAERGAAAEIRPCIPVHNPSAMAALVNAGAQGFWLSGEVSLEEGVELAQVSSVPVGLVAYGRMRAMTSEHCVLQMAGRCIHDCARCELRQQDTAIVNIDGMRYPVRTDSLSRSRIYAPEPLDAAPEIPALLDGGVSRLMVDGTLLDDKELAAAVARVREAVSRAKKGEAPLSRLEGHTSGHLLRPIE